MKLKIEKCNVHSPPSHEHQEALVGQAKPFLIQLWLTRFPQVNLIFLNTGLCFSFITAGADREFAGLGWGEAQLMGLLGKAMGT